MAATATHEGSIKMVNEDRGFGFIRRGDGQKDVFFHCKSITDSSLEFNEQLREVRVKFDIEDSPKGQRAINVRRA
jgi:cold shock protein